MFQNLDIFQMSSDFARHAAKRHMLVAKNIANADTPGYRAQDIAPFSESQLQSVPKTLRQTHAMHMPPNASVDHSIVERDFDTAKNGNSVTLETEMVHATEARRAHSRAMMARSLVARHCGLLARTMGGLATWVSSATGFVTISAARNVAVISAFNNGVGLLSLSNNVFSFDHKIQQPNLRL